MNLGTLCEMVRNKEAWHSASTRSGRVRHNLATQQQIMRLFFFFWNSCDIKVISDLGLPPLRAGEEGKNDRERVTEKEKKS